jgi:predicted RNA-binding Zn-ribbon protein involved in translation (DUF1610 family)
MTSVSGPESGNSPTPRAVPFYCPFCGEQDIRPSEEGSSYRCQVCDRTWEIRITRVGPGAGGEEASA